MKFANDIYTYNRNLMQYSVDTGLISVEQANKMLAMYPYYVPTFRANVGVSGSKKGIEMVSISETIKEATGGDSDIQALHISMARQTMLTMQAGKRNVFGNRLLALALRNRNEIGDYVQTITPLEQDVNQFDIDSDGTDLPELKKLVQNICRW